MTFRGIDVELAEHATRVLESLADESEAIAAAAVATSTIDLPIDMGLPEIARLMHQNSLDLRNSALLLRARAQAARAASSPTTRPIDPFDAAILRRAHLHSFGTAPRRDDGHAGSGSGGDFVTQLLDTAWDMAERQRPPAKTTREADERIAARQDASSSHVAVHPGVYTPMRDGGEWAAHAQSRDALASLLIDARHHVRDPDAMDRLYRALKNAGSDGTTDLVQACELLAGEHYPNGSTLPCTTSSPQFAAVLEHQPTTLADLAPIFVTLQVAGLILEDLTAVALDNATSETATAQATAAETTAAETTAAETATAEAGNTVNAEAEAAKAAPRLKGSPLPSPRFEPPTNPPQRPPVELAPGHSVRVMGPTEQYPNGYWVETNAGGQPLDPSTGKPPSNVSRAAARARTHVPLPSK